MQVLVRKFELEGNAKWILSRSELYLAQSWCAGMMNDIELELERKANCISLAAAGAPA